MYRSKLLLLVLVDSNGLFKSHDSKKIDKSLELAIRLWLMVSFRGHRSFFPGQTAVSWAEDESYPIARGRLFPESTEITSGKLQISPNLTVCGLVLFGGFTIKWTLNLVDHSMLTHGSDGELIICHPGTVPKALQSRYEYPLSTK